MMFGYGHLLFGPGIVGGLGMVVPMMLMWIVPVALVVWLIGARPGERTFTHGCGPAQPVTYDPALEIARGRYARGEIDKATFEQLVAELLGRR